MPQTAKQQRMQLNTRSHKICLYSPLNLFSLIKNSFKKDLICNLSKRTKKWTDIWATDAVNQKSQTRNT